MIHALFAILASFVGQPQASGPAEGLQIGRRFVAAIRGEADFQDSDFIRRLGDGDKAALRRFAPCRVRHIGYIFQTDPTRRNAFVEDFSTLRVELDCRGVPRSTPVGISLRLEDNRIDRIETHNADLMTAN